LFRGGQAFDALYAVRSGCIKSSVTHADAREHVLNFHLPGEIIGLDAVYLGMHSSDAVALTRSSVCAIRFAEILEIAGRMPDAVLHLLRTFSRDSFSIGTLTGDFTAEERLAGFLVSLMARMRISGQATTTFQLPMDRTDIANHLRLASETVSRLFARFQERELISVDRKEIRVLDREGLARIAECINPYARYREI
jgi:CRP/FNR family transcriptional regulator